MNPHVSRNSIMLNKILKLFRTKYNKGDTISYFIGTDIKHEIEIIEVHNQDAFDIRERVKGIRISSFKNFGPEDIPWTINSKINYSDLKDGGKRILGCG